MRSGTPQRQRSLGYVNSNRKRQYLLFRQFRVKINTSLEFQLCKIYGRNKNTILIKILEVQKQDNSIDCGLFTIANAVEFCNNGFKGGTHINYDEKYMRDHLIYCLERGFFSQLPKNRIGRAPTILKTKDHLIPINCDCGSPDTIEDMIGCEGENGRKLCNMWRHKSCAGNIGNCNNWLCEVHKAS